MFSSSVFFGFFRLLCFHTERHVSDKTRTIVFESSINSSDRMRWICLFSLFHFLVESVWLEFLWSANEVEGRLCFYRCLWFCSQGGGIPACLTGLQGGVSQHALQVSRPTPGGGGVRGLARGVSRSTPEGSTGPHLGGLQTHNCGGSPGPHSGGCIPACTEADPPNWWLLLWAVCILLECILVPILIYKIHLIQLTRWQNSLYRSLLWGLNTKSTDHHSTILTITPKS